MKTEKIILSFLAVVAGILISGIVFYFYQLSKTIPPSKTRTISISQPSPTPKPSIFLSVDGPKDEEVFDKKTITIAGKTIKEATIVISTEGSDQAITPATNGNFTLDTIIGDGQNKIEITAIAPNGEEATVVRTVTFSTENF